MTQNCATWKMTYENSNLTQDVDFLVKWGEVTVAQNCATVQMCSSSGAVNDTILYDLQVFNKLAMV